MRTDLVNFLDVNFDGLNFEAVKDVLRQATSESPYRYVVTPNVDHVVLLHRQPSLMNSWASADLCVCDSQILRMLARLRGVKLELVRGSDLCQALFDDLIHPGDTLAVVGGSSVAVAKLRTMYPAIRVVHHEPPMGLRTNADARRKAAEFVASSNARFTLIAVGSPQQEMIAHEVRQHPSAGGFGLCIGAGLDFVTGSQKRAPRFLQSVGLEWAYRLAGSPRRLWKRYLVEGLRIIPIFLRWAPS
jgi:exopolysaccharide biosynthesis WecB/TagA/CpsF family protein